MIKNLPIENVRYNIVEYLGPEEILHLCRTDKEYREICQDNELWIYLLKRDFGYNYEGKMELYALISDFLVETLMLCREQYVETLKREHSEIWRQRYEDFMESEQLGFAKLEERQSMSTGVISEGSVTVK